MVNKSNDKADIYEKIVFLNSKLKLIVVGEACFLTRYAVRVGKLHIYKTNALT